MIREKTWSKKSKMIREKKPEAKNLVTLSL